MKGKVITLVATRREAEALGLPCTIVGIGATSMPYISEDDIVVNVGYCSAHGFRVGMIVEPIVSLISRNGVGYWDDVSADVLAQHFDVPKAACFTVNDFVPEPMTRNPAIYDMELAYLTSPRCKKLYCLKIVNDSLNESECEYFDGTAVWTRVRNLLVDAIRRDVESGNLGSEALTGWPIKV